jgi:hypothetical protein
LAGYVASRGEKKISDMFPSWKSLGKTIIGRRRSRCNYNIKKGLKEFFWKGMDFSHLAQVGGCCERGNEPSFFVKFG